MKSIDQSFPAKVIIAVVTMLAVLPWDDMVAHGEQKTILFVDDHDILYRPGTQRELHQPIRHSVRPVIGETKPWEMAIGYCSVIRNPATGNYQAWYQSYSANRAKDPTRRVVVCYAESKDGIQWVKPNLGIHDFNGDKNTNIVLVGNGGRSVNYCAAVVLDSRESDKKKRYKMAYWDFVKLDGKDIPGLCVAFSPDGKHWKKHPEGPLLRGAYGTPGQPPFSNPDSAEPLIRPAISDVIDLTYDPQKRAFAIYSKTWIDAPDGRRFWKRAVVRTESRDFVNWSAPQLMMTPGDHDTGQLHGAPVFYRHGVYLSLLQRLDFHGFDQGGTGNMPAELAVSRDGISWDRPFQDKMFIPVSGDGKNFDSGCLWTNGTPVFLKNEIRFYYGAYAGWNSDIEEDLSGIGLAKLKRDRFAGLKPIKRVGQVTLKPVPLAPNQILTLNADSKQGSVQVEILTAGGYRLAGFTKDDCVPLTKDELDQVVRWKTKAISDLAAGAYQIRVHLDSAEVFAITTREK